MADVIIVKGGSGSSSSGGRIRRSNSSSYSGSGFLGLSQEDLLKVGALIAGGLVVGYLGMKYVHKDNPTLDWSDLFTPPYSTVPPAKVPPTIVQSSYGEVAPEPDTIEEMNASMVVSEGEDEAGAGAVIVEDPELEYDQVPELASYSVQRYATMRDKSGELIGLIQA